MGGDATTLLPASVTLPLRSEAAISDQITDLLYLKERVLFPTLAPQNYTQAASGTHVQLPATPGSWGMGDCCQAKPSIECRVPQ